MPGVIMPVSRRAVVLSVIYSSHVALVAKATVIEGRIVLAIPAEVTLIIAFIPPAVIVMPVITASITIITIKVPVIRVLSCPESFVHTFQC